MSEECKNLLGNIPILNPDNLVKPYSSQPLSLVGAGRRILGEIKKFIANKNSFAIETTLSGNQYLLLVEQLKQNGWLIGSVYIGVNGEDVCVTRVEERKYSGGHDVPLEDIIRRYPRSLKHVPSLLKLSDNMIILDNTDNYTIILECKDGKTFIKKKLP